MKNLKKTDNKMATVTKKIAVLPGDGIGPEVVAEAVKVLGRVGEKFGHKFEFTYAPVGGCAIDQCGDPYPEETHRLCLESDAVLFGAIGDPKYDNDPTSKVRPEQGLLRMRKSLGLYANLRPVQPFDSLLDRSPLKEERIKGADLMIVRELTGGLYFGEPRGRSENGEVAFDTCIYSREEILRSAEKAFELAIARKGHVTLVDKANVLATSRLWRETVTGLYNRKYRDAVCRNTGKGIVLDYLYVDNAAMQLVTSPAWFDVVLTENLFGDILSDQASVITGSIGLLPSASIGDSVALYEPIHGSFPQAKGKGTANPIATILSAAMMLEISFGMHEEGAAIRKACREAVEKGIVTPDLAAIGNKHYTTAETGSYIANVI